MGKDKNSKGYSETLLKVGEGKLPIDSNEELRIPNEVQHHRGTVVSRYDNLLNKVNSEFVQKCMNPNYQSERTILAPFNDMVDKVSDRISARLPDAQRQYLLFDTPVYDSLFVEFRAEFLHSQQPSGVPSHVINLKVSAPIMLLRNLDASRLFKETWLIVKTFMLNIIQATIMTGCAKGEDAFIPRIPIIPSDFPIEFYLLQFPVHLSYAMTINKSLGQTLKVAGLDLWSLAFRTDNYTSDAP